ncbi:MAG TPA: iron ABC transporter permease [Burkholderiaceae bacterium]
MPATELAVSANSPARRPRLALPLLIAIALIALLFACALGSVALSPSELVQGLRNLAHGETDGLAATLLQLRLVRAATAFVVGATLALAGAMMQALLRNPLADPYVLGVSGGAAVGALFAILLFSALWVVDLAAFGGALAVAFLLFLLAYRDLRGGVVDGNASLLLLTGVIVAAGCGALIALMLSIAPDGRLRGMVFWLIGDLSSVQFRWLPVITLALALTFARRVARSVNVLALHGDNAAALGVPVARLRQGLFFCAAVLTASAVSTAGSIGFVGLIVPHACRFALGPDHRLLFPSTALVGGSFLVIADTLARSILAPQQLPVGVITALIGVPVFLLQLHHIHRR